MATAVRGVPAAFQRNPDVGFILIGNQAGASVTVSQEGPAKPLTGAYGGFASSARTGRRATSAYHGVDVSGMVIPIILDGWSERASIGPDKRLLEAMASPSGKSEATPPQPVYVVGATLPANRRWWVIQSLEHGDKILHRASDGAFLRQDYTITLIDPPDDGIIVTNGKRYTVRKGDTLISIAARQLGDAKRWHQIKDSKGHTIRDAKSVKPGQIVKLP